MTLIEKINNLPVRKEYISGQQFSYVKLDDVLAILEGEANPNVVPKWYVCYDGFGGYFKSDVPGSKHIAICYDEEFADDILDMLEPKQREADNDKN